MVGYLKQQVDMPQFVESGHMFEGKLKVGFECILFTHLKSDQIPGYLLYIGDSMAYYIILPSYFSGTILSKPLF